jgi:cytidyltransferase-like protein
MKIALYPGSFKPPHVGHFSVVKKLSEEMGEVIVIISKKERDGITAEQSYDVWQLYKQLLPENVEIMVATEYSPIVDVVRLCKAHPENEYFIVFGKNDGDNAKTFVKEKFKNVHIYDAGNYGDINATQFRQAIKNRDINEIKTFLPDGINDVQFMETLGQNLHEIKIHPNISKIPKIGQVWYFDTLFEPGEYIISNIFKNEDGSIYYIHAANKNKRWYKNIFPKDWEEKIKRGEVKYLRTEKEDLTEIKIHPKSIIPSKIDLRDEHVFNPIDNRMDNICGILSSNKKYIIVPLFSDLGIYTIEEIVLYPANLYQDSGRTDWFAQRSDKTAIKSTIGIPIRYWDTNKLHESQEIKKITAEQKQIIFEFVKYAMIKLGINLTFPKLTISYDNKQVKERSSFAYYSPTENKVWVYVKNRNIADILRSIAHELVHHKQNEDGRLTIDSGKTGSNEENEANSQAGILLRDFGKINKQIYEIKIHPQQPIPKINDVYLCKNWDMEGISLYLKVYEIKEELRRLGIQKMVSYDLYTLNGKGYATSADKYDDFIKHIKDKYYIKQNNVKLDEIKIHANVRQPKVGDIYQSTIKNHEHHSHIIEGTIEIIEDDDLIEDEKYYLVKWDGWQELYLLKQDVINYIKSGELKLLKKSNSNNTEDKINEFFKGITEIVDEIKIQPNIKFKVGDMFRCINPRLSLFHIKIVNISNNLITYGILPFGPKDNVNDYRETLPLKEFEEKLKTQKFIKLKYDV